MSKRTAAVATEWFKQLSSYLPNALATSILPLQPVFVTVLVVFWTVEPWISRAVMALWQFYEKCYELAKPYKPDLLFPMFAGVVLMLFGGNFTLTIAVANAFRICGWDKFKKSAALLWENYCDVRAANEKDNKVDANNDGIADVLQISERDLVTRKIGVFFKAADPQELSFAIQGIYQGCVAGLLALNSYMAMVVSQGVAIGAILAKPAHMFFEPIIKRLVAPQYEKWVPYFIDWACRIAGIQIALFVYRILSAFYSSIAGAKLFAEAFVIYAGAWGYNLTQSYVDDAIAVAIALFGLVMQLRARFRLPWLLFIPLLPLVLVEEFLGLFLTYNSDVIEPPK